MNKFSFKGLLQEDGWRENVTVTTDTEGKITAIVDAQNHSECNGYAMPGFQNAHSHAFQYAMAGLAELHSTNKKRNDFWSWRQSMYALALKVEPEQMEAIAAMLYQEMLRHGFTHVAEFHYVHHDKEGRHYSNKAELSERIARAAQQAGIHLTIIPIYYEQGGFGLPAQPEQRRFLSKSIDDYINLFEAVQNMSKDYSSCNVGLGIHSMRGVALENIIKVSAYRKDEVPFHIHVSEQLQEIEDCISHTGLRPVEWLAKNINLTANFHLVHATHLTPNEVTSIAKSKANVVICPSTEGNLGDGLFPMASFLSQGGNWSIGTDSHIGLNPFEEIRTLDYGQRLATHSRNTFGNENSGDNGAIAIRSTLVNGRKAMGNTQQEYFKIGSSFDAVVLSDQHPLIQTTGKQHLTNTIVYASDQTMVKGTIVNGDWKIQDNKAPNKNIEAKFVTTMRELSSRF